MRTKSDPGKTSDLHASQQWFFLPAYPVSRTHIFCFGTRSYSGKFCNGHNDFLVIAQASPGTHRYKTVNKSLESQTPMLKCTWCKHILNHYWRWDLMPQQVPLGTRLFIDKTTHRHGFWRQFTDTIEDNSSTLFEDNSPPHYYVEIIPKLIKWRQCFENKMIYYHVYDQNNEFRILIQYFWLTDDN